MATETIPTTITPEARALAKEYGVERELGAILEKGREMVAGLRGLEVEVEPWAEEGDVCIVVRAVIDAGFEGDPSHYAWKIWRIDTFGVPAGTRFLLVSTPYASDALTLFDAIEADTPRRNAIAAQIKAVFP